METESIIGVFLMIFTAAVTYKGLSDRAYQERYMFHVDRILVSKEYSRLFSSGFLHVNWIHFIFNMFALLSFSFTVEVLLGIPSFFFIFIISLVGGNLFALAIHRNHGDYRAVGASGAVSGVMAASIILFPTSSIRLLFIPIDIASWLVAILFIAVSIFGIKSQRDNIGHEAHLGGLLAGALSTLIIRPSLAITNWWIVLLIIIPIVIFIILIAVRPEILLIPGKPWKSKKTQKAKFRRKANRASDKVTKRGPANMKAIVSVDGILEKIKREGIDSLSQRERKILDKYREEL
ncbi:rhomboid family intramembrane serine protease [Saprospiraceae bacterium]|nr:rhomboid family intramembrane serine protease [Saprospiraceae bacterium]